MKDNNKDKKRKHSIDLWSIPVILTILGMLLIAISPTEPIIRIIAASVAVTTCIVFIVVYYIYRKG